MDGKCLGKTSCSINLGLLSRDGSDLILLRLVYEGLGIRGTCRELDVVEIVFGFKVKTVKDFRKFHSWVKVLECFQFLHLHFDLLNFS